MVFGAVCGLKYRCVFYFAFLAALELSYGEIRKIDWFLQPNLPKCIIRVILRTDTKLLCFDSYDLSSMPRFILDLLSLLYKEHSNLHLIPYFKPYDLWSGQWRYDRVKAMTYHWVGEIIVWSNHPHHIYTYQVMALTCFAICTVAFIL